MSCLSAGPLVARAAINGFEKSGALSKETANDLRSYLATPGTTFFSTIGNASKALESFGNGEIRKGLQSVAEMGADGIQTAKPFLKAAGMSDEKIKEKTGCTWERWVWALDAVNAQAWPHGEIAEYVSEKYKVPSWWTQAVTVGYERIRGLREKGQRRTGKWEASKSKTIDAAAGTVFKAFKQAKPRTAWLPNRVVVRTAVPNKSVRLTWEDGTSVEVYLTPKGRSKSVVAVQHTKLESRAAVDRLKAFWAQRLDVLADQLESKKH